MYKVFINEIPVFFAETPNQLSDKYKLVDYKSNEDFINILDFVDGNLTELSPTAIIGDVSASWKAFNEQFKLVAAAGGVVRNTKGEILFIYRLDKWDLPKGKLEKGESEEEGAVREVEEECGISGLTIQRRLSDTYHTYYLREKRVLKQTIWFEMTYEGNEELVPQTEEGITKVEWIPENQWESVFNNTYRNIEEILKSL